MPVRRSSRSPSRLASLLSFPFCCSRSPRNSRSGWQLGRQDGEHADDAQATAYLPANGVAKGVTHASLCELQELRQPREAHLRLEHPKLREVSGGVGVLRAEARPESVHAAQRGRVGLSVQLTRHGEKGLLRTDFLVTTFRKKIVSLSGALGLSVGKRLWIISLIVFMTQLCCDEKRFEMLSPSQKKARQLLRNR